MIRISTTTSSSFLLLLGVITTVTNAQREPIDLSSLGNNTWARFRPGWSLTVNDQCLYQFDFQFEHDPELPIGSPGFQGDCTFAEDRREPVISDIDGKLFLEARRHWERFPDYVWATIGFNHMSVDWFACGHRPKGFAAPHYDLSFFRTTPEFRVHTMGTCDLQDDPDFNVPGEEVCAFNQDTPEGMAFWIVPGAVVNRNPVVNMPVEFTRPDTGNGPIPTLGLRSWDQDREAEFPQQWDDVRLFQSTYQGDLVMWQVHVPYTKVAGETDKFTADTAHYFESTIGNLPDTYAFYYNVTLGRTTFTMLGRSALCREQFEQAEAAFGGPPVFPIYPRRPTGEEDNGGGGGGSGDGQDGGDSQDYYSGDGGGKGKGKDKSGAVATTTASSIGTTIALLLSTIIAINGLL